MHDKNLSDHELNVDKAKEVFLCSTALGERDIDVRYRSRICKKTLGVVLRKQAVFPRTGDLPERQNTHCTASLVDLETQATAKNCISKLPREREAAGAPQRVKYIVCSRSRRIFETCHRAVSHPSTDTAEESHGECLHDTGGCREAKRDSDQGSLGRLDHTHRRFGSNHGVERKNPKRLSSCARLAL